MRKLLKDLKQVNRIKDSLDRSIKYINSLSDDILTLEERVDLSNKLGILVKKIEKDLEPLEELKNNLEEYKMADESGYRNEYEYIDDMGSTKEYMYDIEDDFERRISALELYNKLKQEEYDMAIVNEEVDRDMELSDIDIEDIELVKPDEIIDLALLNEDTESKEEFTERLLKVEEEIEIRKKNLKESIPEDIEVDVVPVV